MGVRGIFKTTFESDDMLFESIFDTNDRIFNSDYGTFFYSKNYNGLSNKPTINDIELVGNKTAGDLKLQEEMVSLTNMEIEEMFKDFN